MNKKLICLFLALACVMSLCLTGCNKPVDTTESTAESTTGTTPTTAETTPTEEDTSWKADNTLKILAIGNSFSVDCMQYVYEIAKAAGVRNVKLGNLYIGGCSLARHLSNAQEDKAAYTYYTYKDGKWVTEKNYKMSDAVKSEDWDFISFQQESGTSGKPDTYNDLNELMPIVEGLCTNKNVEFIWHMTWAYQADSTNEKFDKYQWKQDVMYQSIVDAVKEKIVSNGKITRIVPNGTAIQNARTSYLGDTLTRDGYHLSKDEGRIIAGLSMVATTVGIDWEKINLFIITIDKKFLDVAFESVKNAIENPYQITQSKITE